MAANVEYEFQNYFELDEEKIRRIYSILKRRLPEECHNDIYFLVTKTDNFIYRTVNINDIINEDNDSTSKIKSIRIGHISDSKDVEVILSNNSGASLKVSGSERDDVFLLSSELKEYITKEVANVKKIQWLQSKNILAISMLIFVSYMTYFFSTLKPIDSNTLNAALESTNINEKLNFLINKSNREPTPISITFVPMFTIMIIVLIGQIIPYEKVMSYFFPRNLFLFGKEILIIEKKKRHRSNLFWVVGVGSIISLVAAYISVKFM